MANDEQIESFKKAWDSGDFELGECLDKANAPLMKAMRETVAAWDSLKMGHHQTADVQRWLLDAMAPAITALRPFLESEATNG